ncbi:MAG: hypothetical protein ABSF44_03780 [Candidatus Bathyarchaeia archaeon]|jgi:hypothetical protein
MKKAILVIAIISILLVLLVTVLAYDENVWRQNNLQSVAPEPPLPNIIPGAQNVTGTAESAEAVNVALANSEVKQWTDKGYQLYGVFQYDSIYWVGILTNAQQLPWVVGISLKVPVKFNSSDPIEINFDLTLANLTQNQKEQTLRIASDTIKAHGGNASIDDVSVREWVESLGGKTTFHAYPCVSFRVPEDLHEAGMDVAVYVDLQKGQVAEVLTNPSTPLIP